MLSDEVIEKVIARLINRIEQGNEYVLEQIGKSIKKIGTLTPSKAQELVQVLRYGGDYDKIIKKLAEITKLNAKDIEKIFHEVARNDYNFSRQFYEYRNKKFIPYDENIALKSQISAIAKTTIEKYQNLSNTLAFATHDKSGKVVYNSIVQTYQKTLDTAILNVGQGKETFDSAMYRVIKELAESGIRTVDYESGRSLRLDTAIDMQMQGGLRQMHIEMQKEIGQEFGADGVEISVHEYPAPDHQFVQGKQFSNEEFDKFQNDQDAVSYDGVEFSATSEETGHDRRAITQYNCKHYTFSIILGVNEPLNSNERLKEIIDRNNKGFDYEGKHYTMYEGEQLQRKIETEVRKQKDIQKIAVATDNEQLIFESQNKITQLNRKYKELNKVSGLMPQTDRMRVSGYERISTSISQNLSRNTHNIIEYKNNKNRNINYIGRIDLTNKEHLEKKINEYRNNILWDTKENAYVIDKNGDTFSISGTKGNVTMPKWLDRKDSIEIHNHPPDQTNYSFSKKDLKEFLENQVKESYGDDTSFQYKMIRTIETDNDITDLSKDWQKFYAESLDLAVKNKLDATIESYDYIMKQMAKKHKFIYDRKSQNLQRKK